MKTYAEYKMGPVVLKLEGEVICEGPMYFVGNLYLTSDQARQQILAADFISNSIESAWNELNTEAQRLVDEGFRRVQ